MLLAVSFELLMVIYLYLKQMIIRFMRGELLSVEQYYLFLEVYETILCCSCAGFFLFLKMNASIT